MKSKFRSAASLAGLLMLLTGQAAQAADLSERQARVRAATCATCHGTDGHAQPGMPALAGRDAAELHKLLLDFRSGNRPATIMHQHVAGYSDEELRQITAWFAAQPGH